MKNRLRKQLQTEVDASYLYKIVSQKTEDKATAELYSKMAEIENNHAVRFLTKLKETDKNFEMPGPSLIVRIKVYLTKFFGKDFILSGLMDLEKGIALSVVDRKLKRGEKITGGELNHSKILGNLIASDKGVTGTSLSKLEGRHKTVGGNALRAAVMGANDGLVSNLSLIMGVAGATSGNREILIAGSAGLLAGAISMALGEWLSVQSSRELYKKQIQIEEEELDNSEEEELMELTLIYQAKGLSREKSAEMAKEVFQSRDAAIETLVKEELGIDTNELGGSAWEAAITSFLLFAGGAILPLIPFMFTSGLNSVLLSALFSACGLFVIGGGITLFTGRNLLFSGFRQVVFGLSAAAITFGIGKIIGIAIH